MTASSQQPPAVRGARAEPGPIHTANAATPLVSVITVCFNAATTIADSLESARRQTWRPLEVIVVDGGSRDGTLDIAARYRDVTGVVVSEPDRGIYDAMNKGIGLARGEILYFLNADDSFVDDRVVEEVMKMFRSDPETELVFGNAIYLTPQGRFLRRFDRVTASNLLYGDLCHQAVFARRMLFERFGRFNLDYRINADYDWMLRAFRGGARVRYLDRAIVNFRTGGVHMADIEQTRAERLQVRLRYSARFAYRAGDFFYRLRRKLGRVFGQPEFIQLDG